MPVCINWEEDSVKQGADPLSENLQVQDMVSLNFHI